MHFSQSVIEIIQQRFSCRSYLNLPIADDTRHLLADLAASFQVGPLGTPVRCVLLAATESDRQSLRGLGTYGFIKNPAGFLVGAVQSGERNLEDCGYVLEYLVLYATDLGLGTCWLGGSFTKSRFARRVAVVEGESVPAVVAIGYMAARGDVRNEPLRRRLGAVHRLPWEQLFFRVSFDQPLSKAEAGAFAVPLEMVRLGPSASNKQPWRIVHEGKAWHFFLKRTPGYGDSLIFKLMRLADIQRLDIGIAMCHFALTASELGLSGHWLVQKPAIACPDEQTEYVVSWVE